MGSRKRKRSRRKSSNSDTDISIHKLSKKENIYKILDCSVSDVISEANSVLYDSESEHLLEPQLEPLLELDKMGTCSQPSDQFQAQMNEVVSTVRV